MRLEITGPDESWAGVGATVERDQINFFFSEDFEQDALKWDGERWRSRGGLPFTGQPSFHGQLELLHVTARDGQKLDTSEEALLFFNTDGALSLWARATMDSDRRVADYAKGYWQPNPQPLPNRPSRSVSDTTLLVVGAEEFQNAYHGGFYGEPVRIAPGRRSRRSPLAERVA
jgi:hypothetical protein